MKKAFTFAALLCATSAALAVTGNGRHGYNLVSALLALLGFAPG